MNETLKPHETFAADNGGALWVEYTSDDNPVAEYKRRDGLLVKVVPQAISPEGEILLQISSPDGKCDEIRLQTRGEINRVTIIAAIDKKFPLPYFPVSDTTDFREK